MIHKQNNAESISIVPVKYIYNPFFLFLFYFCWNNWFFSLFNGKEKKNKNNPQENKIRIVKEKQEQYRVLQRNKKKKSI